jgi:hypothetical protein
MEREPDAIESGDELLSRGRQDVRAEIREDRMIQSARGHRGDVARRHHSPSVPGRNRQKPVDCRSIAAPCQQFFATPNTHLVGARHLVEKGVGLVEQAGKQDSCAHRCCPSSPGGS